MKNILEKLKSLQDKKYANFQSKLMPTVKKDLVIGVRCPNLKKYAKELFLNEPKVVAKFLKEVPHKYFDENQLHVFILSEIKDFDICIKLVDSFLPYVDNWATCDQLSPKSFKNNKEKLLKYIQKWLDSKKPYSIRFAVKMLMNYYLDSDFDKKYIDLVAKINYKKTQVFKTRKISIDIDSDVYYVEMMRAWYFATALAKQYKDTFPYIENKMLNKWTHNKTIQKSMESFRISEKKKSVLKKFKY